jgi:arsenate reductase
MAEGLLRYLADDTVEVFSAGSEPSTVNPYAIQAMAIRGIDISQQSSKSLSVFIGQSFDYVITVCDDAAENCPFFPGKAERIHWSFPDPSSVKGTDQEKLAAFVGIRDGLEQRLSDWVSARAVTTPK